jgi:hypothetical protein
VEISTSYDTCLLACKDSPAATPCTHFTFSSGSSRRYKNSFPLAGVAVCELFNGTCTGPEAAADCPTCLSGEKSCSSLELICEAKFCYLGTVVATKYNNELPDCRTSCNSNLECKWFTHYADSKVCKLMKDDGTEKPDEKCTSGQYSCPEKEAECGIPQACDGNLLRQVLAATPESCLDKCKKFIDTVKKCTWFSFHTSDNQCYLFEDCPIKFDGDGKFISGESRCKTLGTFKIN